MKNSFTPPPAAWLLTTLLVLMGSFYSPLVAQFGTLDCGTVSFGEVTNNGNNNYEVEMVLSGSANSCWNTFIVSAELTEGTVTAVTAISGTNLSGSYSGNTINLSKNFGTASFSNGVIATVSFTLLPTFCTQGNILSYNSNGCVNSCSPSALPPPRRFCNGPIAVNGLVNVARPDGVDYPLVNTEVQTDFPGLIKEEDVMYDPNIGGNLYEMSFLPSLVSQNAITFVDPDGTTDNSPTRLCQIDILDIIRTRRFVRGIDELTGAERVAADVNLSGTITDFDTDEMEQVILGFIDRFDNTYTVNSISENDVSGVYPTTEDLFLLDQMTNADNTVSFTGTYAFNPIAMRRELIDFGMVKLGDVDFGCTDYTDPDPQSLTSEEDVPERIARLTNTGEQEKLALVERLPVRIDGFQSGSALQLRIRIEENAKIIKIEQGFLDVTAKKHRIAREGEYVDIVMLPEDMPAREYTGGILFYVTVEMKGGGKSSVPFSQKKALASDGIYIADAYGPTFEASTLRFVTELQSGDSRINEELVISYENPFTDVITVRSKGGFTESPVSVSLLDLSGRVIVQKQIVGHTTVRLEDPYVSRLPAGMYLLRTVTGDGAVATHKLIKQ